MFVMDCRDKKNWRQKYIAFLVVCFKLRIRHVIPGQFISPEILFSGIHPLRGVE